MVLSYVVWASILPSDMLVVFAIYLAHHSFQSLLQLPRSSEAYPTD